MNFRNDAGDTMNGQPLETYRTTPLECPACGAQMDAATMLDDDPEPNAPEAGDLTVCGYCATVCRFMGTPVEWLEALTVDEREAAFTDPESGESLRRIVRAVVAVIAVRSQPGRGKS